VAAHYATCSKERILTLENDTEDAALNRVFSTSIVIADSSYVIVQQLPTIVRSTHLPQGDSREKSRKRYSRGSTHSAMDP